MSFILLMVEPLKHIHMKTELSILRESFFCCFLTIFVVEPELSIGLVLGFRQIVGLRSGRTPEQNRDFQ